MRLLLVLAATALPLSLSLPCDRTIPGLWTGRRGGTAKSHFVTLPQLFLNAGYFTQGTGKVFHTEEGGSGPAPFDGPGSGMPPLQDPPSWSRLNASMANVNSLAPMRPCEGGSCSVPANAAGDPADPKSTFRFCDRIIGDDALLKLRAASANRDATGQPFFLAVGFRKPHLPFRHPSAYDSLYPSPADIPLAKHKTMDASVPPVSYHQTALAADPYVAMDDLKAGTLRRDYYAAISWMDAQLGLVVDELAALGLENDTAIVFHAARTSTIPVFLRALLTTYLVAPLSYFPSTGSWLARKP